MAIASKLTPTFALSVGGHIFPGYSALYTVVLNLIVAIVLTPLFRAMRGSRAPVDATVPADYLAA
jgi:SSS family solute:Na+ symporter